ncbi:lamin tail domain-containing protein, partial [Pirellulales bacterium]|nr:lamin tail domain-containing protein [Pirellulales bacterium]
ARRSSASRCPDSSRRRQIGNCLGFELLEPRLVLSTGGTLVFNEILYNPVGTDEWLEFVELHNQMGVDMAVSAWSIRGGVDFDFVEGTIVPGGGHLVVAADPAALAAATGFVDALGPFIGQLSNGGENLELVDRNGRVMDELDYNDGGGWPVAPDGSGVSLAKIDPITASAPAENWASSRVVGGTLGRENFPQVGSATTTLVSLDQQWFYQDNDQPQPPDWTNPASTSTRPGKSGREVSRRRQPHSLRSPIPTEPFLRKVHSSVR